METERSQNSKPSVEELVRDGEAIIFRTAYNTRGIPGYEIEDVAQELRISAVAIAKQFDPQKGVPWKAYLTRTIRLRAIDLQRQRGFAMRQRVGKPQIFRHQASQSLELVFSDGTARDTLEPTDHGTEIEDIAWQDLLDKVETETQAVKAIVWRSNGLTMAEIGKRLNTSESRVSQILGKNYSLYPAAVERIKFLISGKNQVAVTNDTTENPKPPAKELATPNFKAVEAKQKPPSAPVIDDLDCITRAVELANESTIRTIDERLAALQDQIERLQQVRRVIEVIVGAAVKPKKQKPRTQSLGGQITALIESTKINSVDEIAASLKETRRAVTAAIGRSQNMAHDEATDTVKLL